MLKRELVISMLVVTLSHFQAAPAAAHSGGTNAQGCHTDHRTGDYHCHTPKYSTPDQETYCHVLDGEQRCGYARSTCSNLASRYGGYCVRE
jgi:hypothetical protein